MKQPPLEINTPAAHRPTYSPEGPQCSQGLHFHFDHKQKTDLIAMEHRTFQSLEVTWPDSLRSSPEGEQQRAPAAKVSSDFIQTARSTQLQTTAQAQGHVGTASVSLACLSLLCAPSFPLTDAHAGRWVSAF